MYLVTTSGEPRIVFKKPLRFELSTFPRGRIKIFQFLWLSLLKLFKTTFSSLPPPLDFCVFLALEPNVCMKSHIVGISSKSLELKQWNKRFILECYIKTYPPTPIAFQLYVCILDKTKNQPDVINMDVKPCIPKKLSNSKNRTLYRVKNIQSDIHAYVIAGFQQKKSFAN